MIKNFFLSFLIIINISIPVSANNDKVNFELVLEKVRKSVVSIVSRVNHSPKASSGIFSGSGFIVNAEQGLIITNRHVVDGVSSSTYEVTFFNGREVQAQLLYYDAWADFAILKVDPTKIPTNAQFLKLSEDIFVNNTDVFVVGKSEGQDFSFHQGRLTSNYTTFDSLPYQNLRISLNIKGGASGSPVFTSKGDVIGLVYGAGESFAIAVKIDYINDVLKQLLNKKQPKSQHTGIIVHYQSLDNVKKFSNFPDKVIDEYVKKYPESLNRSLEIERFIDNSPATKADLKIGDIIWAVDGKEIGPNLYLFDKLINDAKEEVKITLYRNGEKIDRYVKLYDANEYKINKFILFGGAYFYEPSDFLRFATEYHGDGVMISNITPGTSFFDLFPIIQNVPLLININDCEGKKISNLNDLVKTIPELISKKYFKCSFVNDSISFSFNRNFINSRSKKLVKVTYNELDHPPTLFYFDQDKLDWKSKNLLKEK